MPYIMASQQELTEEQKADLLRRELEASIEVIEKLTRLMEHIMTKQTDENFPMCVEAVRKENTALKKRIAELKHVQETNLAVVERKKDLQIRELQSKISQTVSEKETLVNETKCMVNKLEKQIEFHEQQRANMSKYIRELEARANERTRTVNTLTEDLDKKQEVINKLQQELESTKLELRHRQFKEVVESFILSSAENISRELRNIMYDYDVEGLDLSTEIIVKSVNDDE